MAAPTKDARSHDRHPPAAAILDPGQEDYKPAQIQR